MGSMCALAGADWKNSVHRSGLNTERAYKLNLMCLARQSNIANEGECVHLIGSLATVLKECVADFSVQFRVQWQEFYPES